jgi:nitrate reductase NapE component
MPKYDPVYLTINDKPRAIINGMDRIVENRTQIKGSYQRRKWIPWILLAAGFPFICIDLGISAFGYRVFMFSLAAPAFWLAGVISFISLRRARTLELAPQFNTAREVFYTLRDDPNPDRNFFGHLDLTGPQQPGKIARETKNALGLTVQHYRDEWLSLKTKLYDGNMLRISAVERNKIRQGYWKRSQISGKNKWKPPKPKGKVQELKVRISVNPEIYEIGNPSDLRTGARIGAYTINQLDSNEGIINLTAISPGTDISASDILSVLRSAYDLLKRKA